MNLEPSTSPHSLDVICAGIVIADCVARPVVKQALPGQLELVERIGLYAGGSAFNTGADLVRLGLNVALVGRVGEDGFGDFMVHAAQRAGCDTTFLSRDAQAPTSATLVTVDASGERAFLHSIGANAHLEPQHLALEQLRANGARVLHLAGFFILPGLEGMQGEPARALFHEATQLGLITSLDCVWDPTGRWNRLIGPVLEFTDLFCPSIHEARAIVNMSDEQNFGPKEVAEALFRLGVRQIVALKMGPEGSFVMARNGEHHLVAAPEVETVDGTGAGDAFIAGFLAAHLKGLSLLECAQMGNAVGALCVGAMGATAGVTDWPGALRLAGLAEPEPSGVQA